VRNKKTGIFFGAIMIFLVLLTLGCSNGDSANDCDVDEKKRDPQEDTGEETNAEEKIIDIEYTDDGYIGELSFEETTWFDEDGRQMVANTNSILVLVNKNRNLPSDYKPDDLVAPDVLFSFSEDVPKRYIREPAALALEKLFKAAEKEGHVLYGYSGYRSYETQRAIFERRAQERGIEEANKTTAFPGQSEHQTGLAMDITSESVSFRLATAFGQTEEGKWIKENAHLYGFIVRYPEGSEHITGYSYEPWHLRYIGRQAAELLHKHNLTLEEFFHEVYDYPLKVSNLS